ncbi:recombinase family protein [Microbacterium sp. NPDC091313]
MDTTTAAGELVANVMMSVAQWERRVNGERTSAASQSLKRKGVKLGRPCTLPAASERLVLDLRAERLPGRDRNAAQRLGHPHRQRPWQVARIDGAARSRASQHRPHQGSARGIRRLTERRRPCRSAPPGGTVAVGDLEAGGTIYLRERRSSNRFGLPVPAQPIVVTEVIPS